MKFSEIQLAYQKSKSGLHYILKNLEKWGLIEYSKIKKKHYNLTNEIRSILKRTLEKFNLHFH